MKKTQEVIGLPVISICDGSEVGKVKELVVNAEKGAVDFVIVDNGTQILGASVIPTEKVLGIGGYALTIENSSDMEEISKMPAAVDLLQKDVKVKNTRILTKKGRLIGETGDIFIDEDNRCSIAGLEFISNAAEEQIKIIPRESVVTFGKNLIVVAENVEETLLNDAEQLMSEKAAADAEKKNLEFSDGAAITGVSPEMPGAPENTSELLSVNNNSNSPEAYQDNAAGLFKEKQIQYLKGRKATKTITDSLGNIIVSEGMDITEEIISKATQEGKLIDLAMNNKA
jgi:uncharacterized protein YrrD